MSPERNLQQHADYHTRQPHKKHPTARSDGVFLEVSSYSANFKAENWKLKPRMDQLAMAGQRKLSDASNYLTTEPKLKSKTCNIVFTSVLSQFRAALTVVALRTFALAFWMIVKRSPAPRS